MKKRTVVIAVCVAVLAAAAGAVYVSGALQNNRANKVIVACNIFIESNPEHQLTSKEMKKKYPYIDFVKEEKRDVNGMTAEAMAINNQLGFITLIPFTDMEKYVKLNSAADVTEQMRKFGYDKSMDKKYLDTVTVDGRYYGIPRWTYHLGIMYNRNLFKDAGLVDSEGYPLYPDTWEELAETASLIKQRTGKAGFFWPNTQGQGGWSFVNLAWSYGVEFMKEDGGRVKACFNTPECVRALEYIKDLKWKYDALPDEIFGDNDDFRTEFGKGEVAMGICSSSEIDVYARVLDNYFDSVAFSKMPKGPAGRYSLCGGTILMFNPKATKEQLDASFLWFDTSGFNDRTDAEARKKYDERAICRAKAGEYVGYVDDSVFKSAEYRQMREEIERENSDFDYRAIKNFDDDGDVIYRMEYKYYQQELYRILDVAIQTVMTDENADCAAIIAEANDKFNKNFLE